MSPATTTLYRPVGLKELKLIALSGYREFPPRLPEQPIFYPVLNEEYARQIARDWNVSASGAGIVTRFAVRNAFLARYSAQTVGSTVHQELWIPAEDLAEMNRNIVGLIEVVAEYKAQSESNRIALKTEPYEDQLRRWPTAGRHLLAQFDANTVVVYQAYRPAIGRFAVEHQQFGGEFSLSRMSWIKPNFLWMMYRSGWGTKEGQEVTLAVGLCRAAFDEILQRAVHSSYVPEAYGTVENWKACLLESPVRLQWDPDHDPHGGKQERRAIQLGLAGGILRRYAHDWIVGIEDISRFVAEQRANFQTQGIATLITPREEVYPVGNPQLAKRLGIEQL